MDSLTQIALGAAVGECIAGRKIGNRAMLWGAIAGTIPDLDVITNIWMNDIQALATHRGISHSILFCTVMPWLFAWMLRRFDASSIRSSSAYLIAWKAVWILATAGLILGSITGMLMSDAVWMALLCVMPLMIGVIWLLQLNKATVHDEEEMSYRQWVGLFFWVFATHVAIDVCTTYGTQILQPFSNLRFTTSNIAVVDPLYTLPLLVGLLTASWYGRTASRRRWVNIAGIVLSSGYLLFTFVQKSVVNDHFEARLEAAGIAPTRYLTNPTIFNSVLWHGVAELDTCYIDGYYSLLDRVQPFDSLTIIPKRRELLTNHPCAGHPDIDVLKWFSDGYYNFGQGSNGTLSYNDWRFGALSDGSTNEVRPVFYFEIDDNCNIREIRDVERAQNDLRLLWDRILGY